MGTRGLRAGTGAAGLAMALLSPNLALPAGAGIWADVLKIESVHKAAGELLARFGKVDCLINAAGGNKPQATAAPGGATFFDFLEHDRLVPSEGDQVIRLDR